MPKGSENEFPSVLLAEQGADPATPGAGLWRAFIKSDGLYLIDDAGNVTGPFATTGAALQGARYQRTTGDYTTTSTSFVDVDATNMALTITTGARRCLVGLTGTVANSSAGATNMFDVDIDGVRQGGTFGIMTDRTPSATYRQNASFTYLTDLLTAASHTFKLQWRTTAGTLTMLAAAASEVPTFWVQEMP